MDLWWDEREAEKRYWLYVGINTALLAAVNRENRWHWRVQFYLPYEEGEQAKAMPVFKSLSAAKEHAEEFVATWFGHANTSRPAFDAL